MVEEIQELKHTVALQAKEMSRLNRQMAKIIKGTKTVYNKDKWTFIQAFKTRCPEKGLLPYLEDIIQATPTWQNITAEKLERFINYLGTTRCKRTKKPIQPSTQNLYIAHLRALIKWGNTPINDTMSILKAHKIAAPKKKIWLHPDELQQLYDYQPRNYEASTYKYFLICCLLGCRVEDSLNISINNLDGSTLRYRPIKTRSTECYINLRPEQIKALERLLGIKSYGYEPTNDMLKKIFHHAGLVRMFDIGTYNSSEIVCIADKVHFHTARHSFATIKYRYSNYTDREIAIAIGHTDFRQTWNYYICDKSPVTEKDKEVKGLFI